MNDNCTLHRPKQNTFDHIGRIVKENQTKFSTSSRKLRIGLPKEYWVNEMSSEISDCWRNVASIMSDAGAEIVECSLPHTQFALPVYLIIANAEASSNLARYDGVRYGRFNSRGNITHFRQDIELKMLPISTNLFKILARRPWEKKYRGESLWEPLHYPES